MLNPQVLLKPLPSAQSNSGRVTCILIDMHTSPQLKPSFQNMFQQSLAVLFKPSIDTFERFEWRGGVASAYQYVLLAAVVSALVGGLFALLPNHPNITFTMQFINRLVAIPLGFAVFTGLVHLFGKSLYKGTGTYAEVAYTFALFYVPISILDSLLGWIPLVNYFMAFVVPIVLLYYGFLAVQSSMNIYNPNKSVVVLSISAIGYALTGFLLSLLFGKLLLN